jgi:thiol-disulfide isomerase/thioredoxin
MLPFSFFDAALPYDRFLTEFGSAGDRERWDRTRQAVALTDDQRTLLAAFTRRTNILVLAGAWCGDCAAQCPIFERFAEAAPVLVVRYLDRDAHPEAQRELQINAGNRVPVAVFFSEDGFEAARYGERTLAAYRRLARGLVPGVPDADGELLPQVVADWLREFERVQWLLRLSPRLRRLHGD